MDTQNVTKTHVSYGLSTPKGEKSKVTETQYDFGNFAQIFMQVSLFNADKFAQSTNVRI